VREGQGDVDDWLVVLFLDWVSKCRQRERSPKTTIYDGTCPNAFFVLLVSVSVSVLYFLLFSAVSILGYCLLHSLTLPFSFFSYPTRPKALANGVWECLQWRFIYF